MINPKTQEELMEEFKQKFIDEVREERNKRLAETDYIHMPDVNLTEEYKTAMNTYRQQLRDIPTVTEEWLVGKDLYSVHIMGVPWPEKPQ
jgi:hypothetical protein